MSMTSENKTILETMFEFLMEINYSGYVTHIICQGKIQFTSEPSAHIGRTKISCRKSEPKLPNTVLSGADQCEIPTNYAHYVQYVPCLRPFRPTRCSARVSLLLHSNYHKTFIFPN
jgi:hypothetical protein